MRLHNLRVGLNMLHGRSELGRLRKKLLVWHDWAHRRR